MLTGLLAVLRKPEGDDGNSSRPSRSHQCHVHSLEETGEAETHMSNQYFGTDGIRGLTNSPIMSAELAMRVGQAAGARFLRGPHKHQVVIGKDTRLSGYMIESALVAGFTSVGMDVVMVGPVPTPAVAMLTRSMRADIGVMISASHNGFQDNGIKLFGPDGYKLSDEDEAEIEMLLSAPPKLAEPREIGRARKIEDARGRYIHAAKSTFPDDLRLDGMKVVVDCANGAGYVVAPTALWELGAEVITLSNAPDGFNINDQCGSTYPQALQAKVIETGAAIGIALDGDADRLIVIDEKGRIVDGDQLMAAVASVWAERGLLRGGGLVTTVMSNMGLEKFLKRRGLGMIRTRVGDRHVLHAMRMGGYNVGGEQSGHIILSDYATTGDGLVAALQILALLVRSGKPASEALQLFVPLPQIMKNVIIHGGGTPLEQPAVKIRIAQAEARLKGNGRLVIRKSGTEPLIRVMAEGEDAAIVNEMVDWVCDAVREAA